jgi:alpha-N-arabinofuranosidase
VVTDPTDSGQSPNVFGTPDLIRFCAATHTTPLITVNAGTGTATEAANWVAYCNEPGNAQRTADGLPNPANIKLWEVGNELYLPGNPSDQQIITVTPQVYAARFLAFASAMRAADPTIKIMAIGTANSTTVTLPYPNWTQVVLQQAASQIDYIAVHNAYFPEFPSGEGYTTQEVYQSLWAAPEAVASSLSSLAQLIAQYQTASRPIGIAITEWGSLFSPDPAWIDHPKTLGSAVYLARLMQVFMAQPQVSVANFFLFTDTSFMGAVGYNQAPKVPYYAIAMYTQHFGTQLIGATLTGAATYSAPSVGAAAAATGVPEVTAIASLDASGQHLYVNFVNRSWSTTYTATDALGGFNAVSATEWSISSPGVTDNNGPDMPSWVPTTDYVEPALSAGFTGPISIVQTAIGPTARVSLPPHSIVTVEYTGSYSPARGLRQSSR